MVFGFLVFFLLLLLASMLAGFVGVFLFFLFSFWYFERGVISFEAVTWELSNFKLVGW